MVTGKGLHPRSGRSASPRRRVGGVKAFAIYTALRLAMFVACYARASAGSTILAFGKLPARWCGRSSRRSSSRPSLSLKFLAPQRRRSPTSYRPGRSARPRASRRFGPRRTRLELTKLQHAFLHCAILATFGACRPPARSARPQSAAETSLRIRLQDAAVALVLRDGPDARDGRRHQRDGPTSRRAPSSTTSTARTAPSWDPACRPR